VVLAFSLRLPTPLGYDRFWALMSLSGALHAMALVLALRSRLSWLSRLAFVVTAAALTIAVPFAALTSIQLFGLTGINTK